ncbi:hypothetical protein E2C01_086200 [Portunus trituberculatus]|uniref:Uncharacterized protein n=1 Tax=Portunus trituberculatus TaxID=210409 RepID=A0A5B7J051_PORTR|nr:hypothetical protein [Portunus trituberculatus]
MCLDLIYSPASLIHFGNTSEGREENVGQETFPRCSSPSLHLKSRSEASTSSGCRTLNTCSSDPCLLPPRSILNTRSTPTAPRLDNQHGESHLRGAPARVDAPPLRTPLIKLPTHL